MTIQERVYTAAAKFRRKALVIRSFSDDNDKAASGTELKKCLGAFDLTMLGIGGIIGAGVFVLTGVAAKLYAGPAVMVSYAVSALAALISAICYSEYAVELPVAGGAFNYIAITYGEFFAWVVACDLILEYTLSAAAIAKGFTAYLASLLGIPVHTLRIVHSPFTLDAPAALLVVALSLLLSRGISESNTFNIAVTALNLLLILFVLCAGFPFATAANYTPFLPYGMRGVFSGASVVFFSFIGFDTVATAAEEVRNAQRDLPIGIIGSLGVCTVLYMLMCLAITGMVPYGSIDMDAPFSEAFKQVGLGWANKIVSAGALTGIITSLLVSLLGQARIYVTLGRSKLLPAWMAKVHPSTQTPVNATMVTACTAGLLALLLDIQLLAELVSIGTLAVFFMVCSGVLYRRYHIPGSDASPAPVLRRIGGIAAASIAFSISYNERAHPAVPAVFLVVWFGMTVTCHLLPVIYVPQHFKVPLVPYVPSLGMLATLHLIGSLGWPAYVRWVVWFILGSIVYLCYGMHQSAEVPTPGPVGRQESKGEAPHQRLLGEPSLMSHSSADVELTVPASTLLSDVRARSSPTRSRRLDTVPDGVLRE